MVHTEGVPVSWSGGKYGISYMVLGTFLEKQHSHTIILRGKKKEKKKIFPTLKLRDAGIHPLPSLSSITSTKQGSEMMKCPEP